MKLSNMKPPIKMLTIGKIVGYPNGKWTEVRDNWPKKKNDAKDEDKKGNEGAGKDEVRVEQQSKAPVQTTNKFVLLEEGEIEEAT